MTAAFLRAHLDLFGEMAVLLLVFAAAIFLGGALIARSDRIRLEDAVYFAFITAFTVGFGDLTPKTRTSRTVAVLLAFLGLIIMGIVVAIAVHAMDIALKARTG